MGESKSVLSAIV